MFNPFRRMFRGARQEEKLELTQSVSNTFPSIPEIASKTAAELWIEYGDIEVCSSSYVETIRYHKETRQLEVQFQRGGAKYDGVEPGLAMALFQAPSKGKFIRANFFGRPYTPI